MVVAAANRGVLVCNYDGATTSRVVGIMASEMHTNHSTGGRNGVIHSKHIYNNKNTAPWSGRLMNGDEWGS